MQRRRQRAKFNPKKHHDAKHYRRLRRELMTMRNGIIRSFEDVSNRSYHPDYIEEIRVVVEKDKTLITHIDPLLDAIQYILGEAPPLGLDPPRVTIKEIEPPKETPDTSASFTIGP